MRWDEIRLELERKDYVQLENYFRDGYMTANIWIPPEYRNVLRLCLLKQYQGEEPHLEAYVKREDMEKSFYFKSDLEGLYCAFERFDLEFGASRLWNILDGLAAEMDRQ